jgi:hypothetical protein
MPRSTAVTVEQYLSELPGARREIVAAMRQLILDHLPPGFEEAINWGMICYQVPLARYPKVPSKQPLMYLGLAAQKSSYTLHAMSVYGENEAWVRAAFERAGRKLDMGKACIHFRRLEDLPLEVIAELVGRTSVDEYIAWYEESRTRSK